MRVAICIITYRRPEGLRRVLDAVSRLTPPAPGDRTVEVEVVVVDNDPAGTGAAVVAKTTADRYPWPVHLEIEEARGISRARNRAVEVARERVGADFVAFIDDDEWPEPSWLDALLRTQRDYSADIVAGPSLPNFEAPAVDWIVKGGFFERPRYATGTELEAARTSNVLIASRVLQAIDPPFDDRFGMTGGEDTHFFARARRAGYRIVWADEAVVTEYVPRSRARPPWLLKRAFRSGSAMSIIACDLSPTARTRATRLAKGCGRVAHGLVTLPVAVASGRGGLLRSGQRIFLGFGAVAGVLGLTHEEYRRTTGQ